METNPPIRNASRRHLDEDLGAILGPNSTLDDDNDDDLLSHQNEDHIPPDEACLGDNYEDIELEKLQDECPYAYIASDMGILTNCSSISALSADANITRYRPEQEDNYKRPAFERKGINLIQNHSADVDMSQHSINPEGAIRHGKNRFLHDNAD